MNYETLLLEQHGAVSVITLNRPERLNALSFQLLEELGSALRSVAQDRNCRCVLLTGAGRGFSSGADLQDAAKDLKPGERPDLGAPLEQLYHPVLREIRAMKKPVIAAINGTAAGAGLNIALSCDVVVAARSAKFIQAFINIGLVPDAGGTWTIPRLIGRARASRWIMSGEALDAEKALDWGLIAETYADEELKDKAQELAQRMATQPTRALAEIKGLLDVSLDNDLNTQLALEAATQTEVGFSDDAWEGILAFVQKRDAKFSGL